MHLTRPKSSKGRSRPAAASPPYPGDADSVQGTAGSPEPPADSRPDRSLRSQSQPTMWHTGQLSRDEVLHVLQHTPTAPPLSLNKYKVLPSIERRRSEVSPGTGLDKNMSKLTLSDDAILRPRRRFEEPDLPMALTSSPGGDEGADGLHRIWPKPPDPGPGSPREAGAGGSLLLLAIRAPCGRRFQQHFAATDTLQMVRASAEARYGAKYGEVSIETMDVPRRSFTDLDMTLVQCGVLNRSVLCISLNND